MEENSKTVICPNCGGAVLRSAKFCGMCGSSTMTVASDPHIGQTVAGRYTIEEPIASGGMGEIYVAKHETLAQRVAVKLLHRRYAADERIVARFFNEARSYCRVKHPHAVTLLDFGRLKDGTLYIVTEFIDGDVLSHFVQVQGRLLPQLAVRLSRQIGEALAAAHSQQIIHRDLKPDNVMVTGAPGGRHTAKVLDFGIARILDDGEHRLTQTGAVFGTPEFMSPEQARGVEVSYASDVYSFGAVVFFMLSGHAPFAGRDRNELIKKHISEPPPMEALLRQKDIPAALVKFVQQCLRKKPEDRPPPREEGLASLARGAATISDSTPQGGLPIDGRILASVTDDERAGANRPASATRPAATSDRPSVEVTRPEEVLSHSRAAVAVAADQENEGPSQVTPRPPAAEPIALNDSPISQDLDLVVSGEDEEEFGADLPAEGFLGGEFEAEHENEGFTWGDEPDHKEKELGLLGGDLDVEEDDFSNHLGGRTFSFGLLLVPLVILAAIAAGYLYLEVFPSGSNSDEPGSDAVENDAGGSDDTTAASQDSLAAVEVVPLPNRVFIVTEAARSAGIAAGLLDQGDVEGAAEQLTSAVERLATQDILLSLDLGATIERAQELIETAETALGAGRCRRADQAIVEMRQISPELRRRFLRPLNECNRRRRNRGVPPRTLE